MDLGYPSMLDFKTQCLVQIRKKKKEIAYETYYM